MTTPLEGTWELIRAEQGGESSPELVALGVQLEISGRTYSVRLGGEIADQGTFIADSAGTITLAGINGPNQGRSIPCIYQIAGNRLRVCCGLDGSLPKKFATAPGSPHYLATYCRR